MAQDIERHFDREKVRTASDQNAAGKCSIQLGLAILPGTEASCIDDAENIAGSVEAVADDRRYNGRARQACGVPQIRTAIFDTKRRSAVPSRSARTGRSCSDLGRRFLQQRLRQHFAAEETKSQNRDQNLAAAYDEINSPDAADGGDKRTGDRAGGQGD